MRARALVVSITALAMLACTGTMDAGDKGKKRGGKGKKAPVEEPSDGGGGGWFDDLPGFGGDVPGEGDDADEGGDAGDGGGANPKPAPGTKPSPAPATPPEGIHQVNSTTWEIERSKKDAMMSNPGSLANASKKGKGYQLSGIKSGSDGQALGLRNGDIVKEVNGYSLASQAEALAAYSALQSEDVIRVKFKRGDGPMNHTYKVVD